MVEKTDQFTRLLAGVNFQNKSQGRKLSVSWCLHDYPCELGLEFLGFL